MPLVQGLSWYSLKESKAFTLRELLKKWKEMTVENQYFFLADHNR